MLFPAINLRLEFKAIDELNFSLYTGSMFRGAFGTFLRKSCCITNMDDCGACRFGTKCPFTAIFKTVEVKDNSEDSSTENASGHKANHSMNDFEQMHNVSYGEVGVEQDYDEEYSDYVYYVSGPDADLYEGAYFEDEETSIEKTAYYMTKSLNLNNEGNSESSIVGYKNSKNPPNPYVIEPLPINKKHIAKGERFFIHVLVIGTAINKIEHIIKAFSRASEAGFGKQDNNRAVNNRAKLQKVYQYYNCSRSELVYALKKFDNNAYHLDFSRTQEKLLPLKSGLLLNYLIDINKYARAIESNELTIKFLTPLRITRNNHVVDQQNINSHIFIDAVLRRIIGVCKYNLTSEQQRDISMEIDFDETYLNNLLEYADTIEMDKELRWTDWSRYSSISKKNIALGGLLGKVILRGNIAPFLPYILIAEFLHIGKSTVMGLGKFEVERS